MDSGSDSSPGGSSANGKRLTAGDFIGGVVTLVWAISMVTDMLVANYDPPPMIYPALLTVLGGIFGRQISKKNGAHA